MQTRFLIAAVRSALFLLLTSTVSVRAQYAADVVSYNPGTGAAAGYTNASAALGEPSRSTPGTYGGPVDPFNPAYLNTQLVSIGTGGSLVVHFATPIQANPAHPYGIDFLIFSGAFFVVTNALDANFNYIGTPATDGSLGSPATGPTRVSVSADGVNFYTLDPAQAPSVAGLFPTDGQGNFGQPVNPTLTGLNFGGLTLAGIRTQYGGSGGGAGYSLKWAQDGQGHPVSLSQISYIKVSVLSGHAQIDGFSEVNAPAPEQWTEDFGVDPATHGWQAWGFTNAFQWDSVAKNLRVTWDTSRPQSIYAHSLGRSLTSNDDFGFALDLRLDVVQAGIRTNRPGAMQVSFGWLNLSRALSENYPRAGGMADEVFEWDWFPAGEIPGYGAVEATVSPIAFDSAGKIASSFTFPLSLSTGVVYRVNFDYTAAQRRLTTGLLQNGRPGPPVNGLDFGASFGDFNLDAFAILVWNENSSPYDSLFAVGTIDQVTLTLPQPAIDRVQILSALPPSLQFASQRGWRYTLESREKLGAWNSVAGPVEGTGAAVRMVDPRSSLPDSQFYRVRADRD